jgi:hypothetical protein
MSLVREIRAVQSKGYVVRGKAYKRYPKQPTADSATRELLFYNALYVHVDESSDLVVQEGGIVSAW